MSVAEPETKEEVRAARIEAEMEKEIADAWAKLLAQPWGRLLLWSILDKCGNFSFPFYGNQMDTLLKGKQQVGAEILDQRVFPLGMSAYTTMLLEAEERDKRLQDAIDEADAASTAEE